MSTPGDLFAEIKAKRRGGDGGGDSAPVAPKRSAELGANAALAQMLKQRQAPIANGETKTNGDHPSSTTTTTNGRHNSTTTTTTTTTDNNNVVVPPGERFAYDVASESFVFACGDDEDVVYDPVAGTVSVPLAPCAYRAVDLTYGRREPVTLTRCLARLGVLRCLHRETGRLNDFLASRRRGDVDEDALGQTRFGELVAGCGGGTYQRLSESVLRRRDDDDDRHPVVVVAGLAELLDEIEHRAPSLRAARDEIRDERTVSFHPGLGELFRPGTKVLARVEGGEGVPLGCDVVQCWYAEEEAPPSARGSAPRRARRRFVVVLEFVVSVGDRLVFVAATDVYPEFRDAHRGAPIRSLAHRVLNETDDDDDRRTLRRLLRRGKLYASIAARESYVAYGPNSFYPVLSSGSSSRHRSTRPLTKGGRVMVDTARGVREGHLPVRDGRGLSGDGLSDTVKEAIKVHGQSARTGVTVPFRDCAWESEDAGSLWACWPILAGFSFTARVWGRLVLGLPPDVDDDDDDLSPASDSCGPVAFRSRAFEQLVLDEDKKELVRAVASHAGGDDDDLDLDVVANKGAASIFLLHGPPGCGKTLTAEAVAETLRRPLYVVTAGDLGVGAAEVAARFGEILELCRTWDALLLLDEADVFLEARRVEEIERNALVCVMLRALEYHDGCLFLSSNRPSAAGVDPAVASRITVALGYPPLDARGRERVWRNLVGLAPCDGDGGVVLEDADYERLATDHDLNGRQIKNAVVLARALARERDEPLSAASLRRAVTAVAGDADETSPELLSPPPRRQLAKRPREDCCAIS